MLTNVINRCVLEMDTGSEIRYSVMHRSKYLFLTLTFKFLHEKKINKNESTMKKKSPCITPTVNNPLGRIISSYAFLEKLSSCPMPLFTKELAGDKNCATHNKTHGIKI